MTAAKRPHSGKSAVGKSSTTKASTPKPGPAAKSAGKPASKAPMKQAANPVASAKAAGKPAAKPEPAAPPPAPAVKQPPRSTLMPKLIKALKASYKPVIPSANRPVLEQVLYACCLENAPADVAEKALKRVLESGFDLNELRVTTVAELAEALHDLPDPPRAALGRHSHSRAAVPALPRMQTAPRQFQSSAATAPPR